MSYSIDRADLVSAQLERFTTAYAHQVVGHFASVDYWMSEARHALDGLDGYNRRIDEMAKAQRAWVEKHNTLVGTFCPLCGGQCELGPGLAKPDPPTKVPSHARQAARRRLVDAAYHFLTRCFRMSLLDEAALRAHCDALGTSIDPGDLKKAVDDVAAVDG